MIFHDFTVRSRGAMHWSVYADHAKAFSSVYRTVQLLPHLTAFFQDNLGKTVPENKQLFCFVLCVWMQRSVGRRRRNACRSRCYRQLEKLECDLVNERRRAERFKQRYHRLVKKMAAGTPTKRHYTPRSKTRKLLRQWSSSHDTVKRTLIFHNAVLDDLWARYAACKSKNAKRKMANLIMGEP